MEITYIPAPAAAEQKHSFNIAIAQNLLLKYDEKKRALLARGARPPIRQAGLLPARNGPCPCESGKKYKHCCRRVQPYVEAR